MKNNFIYKLEDKSRLDSFLVKQLKQNKSYVDKLLENKLITVNNEIPFKKGLILKKGDKIIINEFINNQKHSLIKSNKQLEIIYEDDDVIIINKPKNMICHPTSFNENDTVINVLLNKINIKDFDDQLRPGIVQRLDRNTTGLMVIAKNKLAYESLINQINKKILIRKYLALVHHKFTEQRLLIKAPIDRSKQSVLKMTVSDEPKAKYAETEVFVLENYQNASYIECQLHTGRTHQIRVHLSYIHHPIFNDSLYGKNDGYKDYEQFLHSYKLSFYQPTTDKLLEFECKPDKTFIGLKNELKNA
ncbi:MAG: RluA family pseudouridine synthase [Mycoplasmataceae bacterium]|jgi:23S rRNA pseudouridine1911/1915/1917 synthase|nr:RluA family pseudouridine synthase [Mycoplasmataceae bacterium]